MSKRDFTEEIRSYIKDAIDDSGLRGHDVFFCRSDGVLLFGRNSRTDMDNNSIGALLGGVWQAAETLSRNNPDEYRLSFDTSNSGVYVTKVSLNEKIFYLATIYENQVNPGQLKLNFRSLRNKIVNKFGDFDFSEKKSDKFLFENITDDEIDNMFGFGRN